MIRVFLIAGAIVLTVISQPALAGQYCNAVAAAGNLQGRVLWCDAEANMWALNTREQVAELVNRCKDVNINTIVVDVKPLCGLVLYHSSIAPRLKEWQGRGYNLDHDLLQVMLEEGHRAGIEVCAAINVFSEGQVNVPGGPAFAHPEWQCVKYEPGGLIPVGQAADQHLAVFVNPANQQVREYELSIVGEIVTNYDVDGIVFDRMRYPGIYADFSDDSRRAFESWIGAKVERYPDDILTLNPTPGGDVIRGKYFPQWMEWRAKQIHDFVADARKLVKSIKPKARLAGYVGSWYSSYYDVGVNWASPEHQPPYDWAQPSYKATGFADMMDWLCTGCYYPYATRDEARGAGANEGNTVEAAGQESNSVVEDDAFIYASLYVLDYRGKPEAFERAIAACNATTQGVMIFDLCYIRDYNWWDILKRAFANPSKAPHQVPGLVEKVREVRRLVEESGKP